MLRKIAHVAVAVNDLEAAIELYSGAWGMTLEGREIIEEQGVEEATFRIGESRIQLLHPLNTDSVVGRFIAARGEGLHHIAYEVDDIAETLTALSSRGIEAVQEAPQTGAGGSQIAFVHPKNNRGVLIELIQGIQGASPPGNPPKEQRERIQGASPPGNPPKEQRERIQGASPPGNPSEWAEGR